MKRDSEYPIQFKWSGTTHFISVAGAQRFVATLQKQIDKEKDRERKLRVPEKELNRIIGENIRRERTELKLTAAWVAKKAGLSVGFLSDVENGKRGIGAGNLLAIAQAIGCTFDALLKGAI